MGFWNNLSQIRWKFNILDNRFQAFCYYLSYLVLNFNYLEEVFIYNKQIYSSFIISILPLTGIFIS
jgi:hypothetical protein